MLFHTIFTTNTDYFSKLYYARVQAVRAGKEKVKVKVKVTLEQATKCPEGE